jgi:hypothetical protein
MALKPICPATLEERACQARLLTVNLETEVFQTFDYPMHGPLRDDYVVTVRGRETPVLPRHHGHNHRKEYDGF